MPVTPLHLGPGAFIKAVTGRHISLMVFAFAQFTMDLEVLFRLLTGAERLHGFSNTVIGATVVLLGRPLCLAVLRWWNSRLSPRQAVWLSVGPGIDRKAAWVAGIRGVLPCDSGCLYARGRGALGALFGCESLSGAFVRG